MTDDSQATGDTSEDDTGLSRRNLVAAGAATWATLGAAGCTDIEDRGGDYTLTDTVTVTSDTTTTDSPPGTDTSTGDGSTDDGTPGGDTPTDTATPTVVTTTACSQSTTFLPGMDVAFLIGVYRTQSGEILGPEAVDSVTVRFPDKDVEPLDLGWEGRHSEIVADRWGGKIADTADLPEGGYRYEVHVSLTDGEEKTITDQFALVDPDG